DDGAQRALKQASTRPWSAAAWLPEPGDVDPDDDVFEFDFDPAPLIRSLPCPLLATAPDMETLYVPGGGHAPTVDGDGEGPVLPGYEAGLIDWIARRIQPA